MANGLSFLENGGEQGERIRAYDWSASPLGTPDTWPAALRTAVGLLLGASQPVYVAWGPELTSLYNDGYIPILGSKHPDGLGQPFEVLWSEIWDEFRPIVEATMAGTAQHFVDLPIALAGRPGLPVGYFTFSYTVLRDDDGAPQGFYCAATETTQQVIAAQRQVSELEDLARLLEEAPSFMAVLDGPEHVFTVANRAFHALVGPRDLIGRPARDAFSNAEAEAYVKLLDTVYETGEPFIGKAMRVDLNRASQGPLEQAFVNFVYQPVRNAQGDVTGIFVEGSDVTELRNAEIALRHSDLRTRLALEAADTGVWEATVEDGNFVDLKGDDRALSLLGTVPGQKPDFGRFMARVHAEDRLGVSEAATAVVNPKGSGKFDIEFRVSQDDAAYRWINATAQIVAWEGRLKLIGTVGDVTAQRDASARQSMLSEELSHRIKNMMAMISAISTQTLQGEDIAERRDAFNGRIATLSHAHDILVASSWANARLRATLETTIATTQGSLEKFTIEGPDLWLNAKQSLSLTLALHELATNSLKYGALSAETGHVTIGWTTSESDPDLGRVFRFRWQESGGPEVKTPTRKGFGSRLITRVVAADFNGNVTLRYPTSGVVCELVCPIREIGQAEAFGQKG